MILTGIFFMVFGVFAEIAGGTMFRSFFDWRNYPPKYPKGVHGNDVRIKILGARLMLLVGFVMVLIGVAMWATG